MTEREFGPGVHPVRSTIRYKADFLNGLEVPLSLGRRSLLGLVHFGSCECCRNRMYFSFDILSYQALVLARVEEAVRELIGLRDCVYAKRARFRLSTSAFCARFWFRKGSDLFHWSTLMPKESSEPVERL